MLQQTRKRKHHHTNDWKCNQMTTSTLSRRNRGDGISCFEQGREATKRDSCLDSAGDGRMDAERSAFPQHGLDGSWSGEHARDGTCLVVDGVVCGPRKVL